MKRINKILNFLGFGKEELNYPIPCGIIDYTEEAKLDNIKDDENKVLNLYVRDKYGNIERKEEKYNKAKVYIYLKKGIPIVDKTKEEQRFEVVLERTPSEITYTKI